MITILIVIPFALPIAIIGVVKHFDGKNGTDLHAQNTNNASSITNNTAHAPTASSSEVKTVKRDMTVSNVLFIIGTIFVVLSGLAFGVASWVHTTHTGRVAIIAAAAAVTFLLSAVIGKFLKLTGTSVSFYILGTGFSATALLTASYYKLLGTWLSFDGAGTFALLAISAALVTAFLFAGFKLFKKNALLYTAISTALFAFYFTVMQIFPSFEGRSVAFTVIASAMVMLMYGSSILKDKPHELALKIIGSVAVFAFGCISAIYVFSVLRHPTISAYFIVLLMIGQFIAYGIKYKNIALKAAEAIISMLFSYMAAMSVIETLDSRYGIIVFCVLSIIIYALHCIAKELNNSATEIITLVPVLASAFIAVLNTTKNAFMPEFIIGIAVSAIIVRYILHKNKTVQTVAGIAAPVLPFCISSMANDFAHSSSEHSCSIIFGIYVSVLLAFTALLIFLPHISFDFHSKHPRRSDAVLYTNLSAAGIVIFAIASYDTFYIVPIVLCMIHFALSNRVKYNFASLLSSFSMIFSVYMALNKSFTSKSVEMLLILLSLTVVYVLISRFVYHDGLFIRINDKFIVDPMLLTAWLPIMLMYQPNKTNAFFTLIALAVYIAGFIKKNSSKATAAGLLTVTASLAALALMTRPYLVPESKAVSSKINIAVIVLVGIACRFIWREFKNASKMSSEAIFIISAIALLFDTLYFDTAANTIFSMSVMLTILIISIMLRSKTWFTASSISLFTITVYATREYLMALNWWIYLFIAGIILIALAAGNEYCKKNNETIKTSVVKKFSGWTW